MTFFNNKSEERPLTFAKQLSRIKSQFKIAHENASNLCVKMNEEITKKESQITILQEDIRTINATKQEAETFMFNIEKFI